MNRAQRESQTLLRDLNHGKLEVELLLVSGDWCLIGTDYLLDKETVTVIGEDKKTVHLFLEAVIGMRY